MSKFCFIYLTIIAILLEVLIILSFMFNVVEP